MPTRRCNIDSAATLSGASGAGNSKICVATGPGKATVTVIGAPTAASSDARHSLSASTARFDTWYAPCCAPVVNAAIDDVCSTLAGSPCAMSPGTKARTPW